MRQVNFSAGSTRVRPLAQQIDLNLLELFDSIYRTRNLTASGHALGISQPAVSRGLARLRRMYDDVLFVRHQRGVLPTPFADSLAEPLTSALTVVRATLEKPTFDPATSRRTFRFATSDIGEHFFLPRLSRHLAKIAPLVRVDCLPFPEVALMGDLASGGLDLAAGFLPALGKQVHLQRLFRERFVFVMRRKHPAARRNLTIGDLRGLNHLVVNHPGTPHASQVARVLSGPGVRAPIALQVRGFTCVGPIVANTDLVAAVPSNLAAMISEYVDVKLVEPPVKFPAFDVTMAWHNRLHRDPAVVWFRSVFELLFKK